jgi:hypothetical protein
VLLRRHALPRLGHLQLQELSPLTIQNFYSELLAGSRESGGLSAGTVLNLHLVLNQAFAQAVRWQLLAANPVAGAQPPRPRRPGRLLVDPPLLARLLGLGRRELAGGAGGDRGRDRDAPGRDPRSSQSRPDERLDRPAAAADRCSRPGKASSSSEAGYHA